MSSKLSDWWQQWLITADEATTHARDMLRAGSSPMKPTQPLRLSGLEPRILFSATPVDPSMMPGGDEAVMVAEVEASPTESDAASIQSLAESTASEQLSEIILIDSSVPDLEQLLDDLSASERGAEVFVLDADRDGVDQITEILESRNEIASVHIVSHAEDGAVKLGNVWLGESNLSGYAGQIASWASSLTSDADILLYGCDLADSNSGQSLIESIGTLSGADVAASVDDTGHARFGANWQLEYEHGVIETQVVFSADLQHSWQAKLSTITVNTLVDETTANGFTSLREAILQSNAGGGGDTILLGSGTHALTIDSLDITQSVTITGVDARTTVIDATGLGKRVFGLSGGSTVDMSRMTIQGGDENTGGGIFVSNTSTLILSNAVLQNNTSDEGGAIHVDGTAHLDSVLLTNNSAADPGPGDGEGGAIYFHGANGGSLTNVTISGNTAEDSGGGLWTDSDLVIRNSTFTLNAAADGGGIANTGGMLSITNTIVAGNTATSANDDVLGAFTSDGFNLIEVVGAATGFGGDITGVSAGLGALDDYGGQTDTHALLAGSAAINSGANFVAPALDQRGETRDSIPDIGAFESTELSTKIYWAEQGSDAIFRANADGTAVQQIIAGLGDPIGLDVDLVGGKIYWIESTTNSLHRADLDGSGLQNLDTTNLVTPKGIGLDLDNGHIYVADDGGGVDDAIRRFNLDGTGFTTIVDNLNGTINDVAADATGGMLYFTEGGVAAFDGEIKTVAMTGGPVSDVVTGQAGPASLAVDAAGGKVYWTDNGSLGVDSVKRADVAGLDLNVETLSGTGMNAPRGIAIDRSDGKVYWSDASTDIIRRSDLDGDNDQDVLNTGLGGPQEIAVFTMGTAANSAPTLSGGPVGLTGTDEDTTSIGVQVDSILAGLVTGDADGSALGLAVTVAAGDGTWQYSTDSTDGSDGIWTDFGTVASDSALLLADATWVRYDPNLLNGETASLTFHAWDGYTGTASATGSPSTADPLGGGGTTAFSDSTAEANLAVSDLNDDPDVAAPIADQVATQGDPFSFQFAANTFDDVDGDSLTYAASLSGGGSLPSWLAFDDTTRTFSGTPSAGDVGSITVRVTADDGNTGSEFDEFVLTVAADAAPTDLVGTATKLGGLSLNQDGGNNAYLIADDGGAIFGGVTALTLEAQFQSTTQPVNFGHATIVSYANGNDSSGDDVRLGIRRNDGLAQFDLEFSIDGNFVYATSFDASTLFDGAAHQVSVTWDNVAGEYAFYVDGTSVDSGSGLAVAHTIAGGGAMTVGTDQDSIGGGFEADQVFQGTLHDLRLFSNARTSSQISSGSLKTLRYDAPGMVANWTFNDLSTGGVVTDKVSGNNLSVQNGPVGGGFTASEPELTYAVTEADGNGTLVARLAAADAEREAMIAQLLAADPNLSYSAETGKFYQHVASTASWSDAQVAATSTGLNGASGQLVTIRSAAEQEFVHAIAAVSGQTIWMGGSDQTLEGEWHWYNGAGEASQFWTGDFAGNIVNGAYQHWDPTEPNNLGNEDFLRMYASGPKDTLWDDGQGSSTHAYIIEWDADDVLDQTDPLIYSLVDDAGGRFAIHADSGTIRIADSALVDYETTTSHSIIVRVTDSGGNQYDQSLVIDVLDVNEAPITDSEAYNVTAGRSLSITASGVLAGDYDPEGDSFTAVMLTPTTNGTLTLNADGSFTYTPNAGFTGTDTFTYEAWDGSASSTSTVVTITVDPAIVPLPPSPPPIDPGDPDPDPTDDSPDEPADEDPVDESEDEDSSEPGGGAVAGSGSAAPPGLATPASVSQVVVTSPSSAETDSESAFQMSLLGDADGIAETDRTADSRPGKMVQRALRATTQQLIASSTQVNYALMAAPGVMWNELDERLDEVDANIHGDLIVVGTAGAAASSFTVVAVAWALRTGFLASGLLAQMPAWRGVDPMLIMQGLGNHEDEETLEELMKRQSQSLDQ